MRKLLNRQPKSRGPRGGLDPSSPSSTDSEDDPDRPTNGFARGRMESGPSAGGARPTSLKADPRRDPRRKDGNNRATPSLLHLAQENSTPQALGTLGSRLGGTSHRDHSNELESPEVAAVAAAGANMSWKQPHITPHGDGSGDDDGSMGGGRVSEEEPLLREEVADFVGGIDFRDGTGPSALPPNDVSRAFRDAENFAAVDGGVGLWSRLTGDDGSRHSNHRRGGEGGALVTAGRVGSGGSGRSTGGRRRRVVHVESATTGKFFKVYEALDGSSGSGGTWGAVGSSSGRRQGGSGGGKEETGETNEARDGVRASGDGDGGGGAFAEDETRAAERLGIPVREVTLMRLDKALETVTLLVQGGLAGLTLASMFTMLLAECLESFVTAYEAQASEFRRAMFILCTLALTGTEDQFMQAKGKGEVWAKLGWWGRLDLRVCVCLYGGCLVSSLVCAVGDTGIANAYGSLSEDWYIGEVEDGGLRSTILLWYGCNLARFVFAWTGWFLVCRRQWRASLICDQSQIELKGQRDKLAAAEERISRLNGRNLDSLTTKELQDLRSSLKRALDNAERMIGLR